MSKDFEKIYLLIAYSLLLCLWLFIFSFSKKLILLIGLEIFMLSTIFYAFLKMFALNNSYFLSLILCIMMVMDSVFGVSILIFFSRCNNYGSSSLVC